MVLDGKVIVRSLGPHGEAVVLDPLFWVGPAIVHGDVCRRPESPGVEGFPDRCPERLGAEVIWGGAPAPLLGSAGLLLSMAPDLDGVADVTVVVDPMVHGGTPRGKLTPLLLPGLGAPSPRAVGATAKGVTSTSAHQQGVSIEAIPVGGDRRLG
jgi:hypothetical protein